ncbi:MAG: DUF4249 family protein [Lishizhenia sp.]
MRNYILFLSTVVLLGFSSCQKVIDINLNEADPKLSIDAVYNATDERIRVSLGFSSNYFSNEESAPIDAAVLTIIDSASVVTNIPNVGGGVYELENYSPLFNSNYTLKIEHDGTTYTATSFLPEVTELSFISTLFVEEDLFGDEGYIAFMNIINDQSKDLYFRMVPFVADTLYYENEDLYLFDNAFVGEGNVQVPLFSDRFQLGDTLDIELRSFNEETYNYYNEIAVILTGQSAAPTNPKSNWDNNALGFFQTWGYSKKRKIIE